MTGVRFSGSTYGSLRTAQELAQQQSSSFSHENATLSSRGSNRFIRSLYRKTATALLHAKTLTMDGEVSLIGSANLDRRSFELNYENNVLIFDRAATEAIIARQYQYLRDSVQVAAAEVAAWSQRRRLWNNTLAMLGPLL